MASEHERIYDGNRAREVLENEAFIQAWTDIEQELTEAWRSSPARDVEGREKIYLTLHLLYKLKAKVTQTFETGKLAELDLKHKQSLLDRMKSGVGL